MAQDVATYRFKLIGSRALGQSNGPGQERNALDCALSDALTHVPLGQAIPLACPAPLRGAYAGAFFKRDWQLMQSLRPWGPTIGWAALVTAATCLPASSAPAPALFPGADKLVHAGMFAVLTLLALRARERDSTRSPARWIVIAAIAAFAVADESVQRFVPGRQADIGDWFADMFGVVVALLLPSSALWRREITT